VVRRLVQVGVQHRVTSIADYIGARFGKRQSLSMLVTAVAAAAVLPYIALQFRALAQAWATVAGAQVEAGVRRCLWPFCWRSSPSFLAPAAWMDASATRA
jgi:Na+/proline symporter